MLIGINRHEKKQYILAADRESEKPTKFMIGNISAREKTEMMGTLILVGENGKVSVDSKELQKRVIDVVKSGLKEIVDFYDPDKKQPVTITDITDEIIDALPFDTLYEIAGEILQINLGQGIIRKN